jgi:hypothetical protein
MKRILLAIIFSLAVSGAALAFSFQVQNDIDNKIVYHLYWIDTGSEYDGPDPQAGGELAAKSSIRLAREFSPGIYFVKWWAGSEIYNEKLIEVDESVMADSVVVIILTTPTLEIWIDR